MLRDAMSLVDSPFHVIAALDDTPDVPEVVANGSAAATVATSLDAEGQERESVKSALESNVENGGNDAAGKNGSPKQEPEQMLSRQERKVSFEGGAEVSETVPKKSKKRSNVWTKTTSRKSAKKVKNSGVIHSDTKDDNVLLKPFHQEDDPSYPIILSKIYKAEKIDLSSDRLTASGSKGYRMVRATRGVVQGAWYFEIYVDRLGDTGHTRLGWSTRRGDLQAPVGYDAHSYSYRDLDGCKVHTALREEYGNAYHEKDVIGFYINLHREPGFMQKMEEEVVGYKGQPYIIIADEPLKPLPGSEILFFKNGVCQGVAFKDVNDGTYHPAASMYTLPSQDCCKVVFNFGPDFRYPVTDVGDRPLPSPMCQVAGPGQTRMETVPKTQTEADVDSTDDGDKWMASERGNTMEVGEGTEPTKEENSLKEVERVQPVTKKKVRKLKAPARNHMQLPLYETSEGEFELHPESKRDANLKSFKNDTIRLGVGSPGLLSHKGDKKDTAGRGLRNAEGIQNDDVLLDLKEIPKNEGSADLEGTQRSNGKSNLKRGQKDIGTSLKGSKKALSLTDTPSSKGIKQDMSILQISNGKGTGLQSFPVKGPQIFQKHKIDLTVAGLQRSKERNRETSGSGLPKPKKIKKDRAGTESVLNATKDLTGTEFALKASKEDFFGTGSGLRAGRKDLGGTESSTLKIDKKGLPGNGPIHKPSKIGLGSIGSVQKPSKKNLPRSGPIHKSSKVGLRGTVSVQKPSKNNVPGKGSVHIPSTEAFSEPGYLPNGLGLSAFSGGKSWGDGIRGTTIDVVVVETSTPTEAAGPLR